MSPLAGVILTPGQWTQPLRAFVYKLCFAQACRKLASKPPSLFFYFVQRWRVAKLRPGGRLLRLAAACYGLVAVYCVRGGRATASPSSGLEAVVRLWRAGGGDELQMTALRGAQAYSLRGY